MKKLKKLTLSKETITNLNQKEMNELKGGNTFYGLSLFTSSPECCGSNQPTTPSQGCCKYGCCYTLYC